MTFYQDGKRVLVFGGAGFIGSNICRALIKQNREVVCVDNFSTGARENVLELEGERRFRLIHHDVREPFTIEADAAINLACAASPRKYQHDPIGTLGTSFNGSLNILELCRRGNIPVLFSSTSEVYGNPEVSPQDEDYPGNVSPIGPRACYDEGKRCAETLFTEYRKVHGVDTKIARIFNTYGPFMQPDDGRVVSNFIMQALLNEPITIYGDGQQTRSFCYIDDLVVGLLALLNSPSNVFGPFNLGNPHEITVAELANTVIDLTGAKSKIVNLPMPADDPERRRPDISRAHTALDWLPSVELKDGLSRTISWFEEKLQRL